MRGEVLPDQNVTLKYRLPILVAALPGEQGAPTQLLPSPTASHYRDAHGPGLTQCGAGSWKRRLWLSHNHAPHREAKGRGLLRGFFRGCFLGCKNTSFHSDSHVAQHLPQLWRHVTENSEDTNPRAPQEPRHCSCWFPGQHSHSAQPCPSSEFNLSNSLFGCSI